MDDAPMTRFPYLHMGHIAPKQPPPHSGASFTPDRGKLGIVPAIRRVRSQAG